MKHKDRKFNRRVSEPYGLQAVITKRFLTVTALCLISSMGPSQAADGKEKTLLHDRVLKLSEVEGQAYRDLRDTLAADDMFVRQLIEDASEDASTSFENWKFAFLRDRIIAQSQFPEAELVLDEIKGVQPAVYEKRRRAEPEVARELRRLQLPPSILIERFLKKVSHPFAEPLAYERTLTLDAMSEIRGREKRALQIGILHALGDYERKYVQAFLLSILKDDAQEFALRRIALHSLGRMRSIHALPEVMQLAHGDEKNRVLQTPAILALGLYANIEAVETFNSLLKADAPLQVNQTVVRAIGILAVKANRAQPSAAEAQSVRDEASRAIIRALPWLANAGIETQLVETISLLDSTLFDREMSQHRSAAGKNSKLESVMKQVEARRALKRYRAVGP